MTFAHVIFGLVLHGTFAALRPMVTLQIFSPRARRALLLLVLAQAAAPAAATNGGARDRNGGALRTMFATALNDHLLRSYSRSVPPTAPRNASIESATGVDVEMQVHFLRLSATRKLALATAPR